jgi:hypothetical protein
MEEKMEWTAVIFAFVVGYQANAIGAGSSVTTITFRDKSLCDAALKSLPDTGDIAKISGTAYQVKAVCVQSK